jgi:hypothetical protein
MALKEPDGSYGKRISRYGENGLRGRSATVSTRRRDCFYAGARPDLRIRRDFFYAAGATVPSGKPPDFHSYLRQRPMCGW